MDYPVAQSDARQLLWKPQYEGGSLHSLEVWAPVAGTTRCGAIAGHPHGRQRVVQLDRQESTPNRNCDRMGPVIGVEFG